MEMKRYGSIAHFRRAIQRNLFECAELVLMRSGEFAALMSARADGGVYDITHDFRQLRFEVMKTGDEVKICLKHVFGPVEFCEYYAGTPRGVFLWSWFEDALEDTPNVTGNVPDANAWEFTFLLTFIRGIVEDEQVKRFPPRTRDHTPAIKEIPSFQMAREESGVTRH